MSGCRVEITAMPGAGKGNVIRVDGNDITNAVRGYRFSASVDTVPQLELDLCVFEAPIEGDDVRVIVPDSTREALLKLGWTPPE